jgi:hypothetical protein
MPQLRYFSLLNHLAYTNVPFLCNLFIAFTAETFLLPPRKTEFLDNFRKIPTKSLFAKTILFQFFVIHDCEDFVNQAKVANFLKKRI